jgi:ACS family hexuronate transporter-like MFS transporter
MRGTWAFALAYAITAPVFWFYLYWLPPFLNQQYQLGISVTQMGIPLIVIYLSADIGSVGGGALSSWLISRGMPAVRARLLSMLIFAVCITSIVMAAGASSLWMAVAAISVAIGAHQAWTANIWSMVMDYTPKHVVSSVFGFGGMIGAVGGMFMTQLVGYVLTVTHNNYAVLFTMIPCAYFIALTWLFFLAPRKVPDAA